MKAILILFTVAAIVSCNSNKGYTKAKSAEEAGTEFIRASLDGDYKKARFYLLNEPDNQMLVDKLQSQYQQMTEKEKLDHKEAAIRPISIKPTNDSVFTYTYYQSSNIKDTTTIRIVRKNDDWLVDLKSVIKM